MKRLEMGCDAPLGYDDECEGDCTECDYWDEKFDDDEDDVVEE